MRIYLIFYILKLKLVLDNAKVAIDIKLEYNKYKVKEIKDL